MLGGSNTRPRCRRRWWWLYDGSAAFNSGPEAVALEAGWGLNHVRNVNPNWKSEELTLNLNVDNLT